MVLEKVYATGLIGDIDPLEGAPVAGGCTPRAVTRQGRHHLSTPKTRVVKP